jgi:antitoxin CptB
MGQDDRIRWRCRRGLLELDLVLSNFLNKKYAALSEQQKDVFLEITSYPDNDLWDLLSGRAAPASPAIANLIELFE